jgi:ApbE superfamily uncharacterized protein (UPF0280 family)
MNATRALLDDGRWHFQHGPIDLVIGAEGDASAVAAAHEAAWQRFESVLFELVAELPLLRAPVAETCALKGVVAQRMWRACHPYRAGFITSMAAVAGSVAQEIIAHYTGPGITRAWVNNGGDIALHLSAQASVRIGLWADLARLDEAALAGKLATDARFTVHAHMPVRGVATSGWRGRSFSLGIADSVTVLAATAAEADAAATVIANAVDIAHEGIVRRPANTLKDDTDLGHRLVTVDVPALSPQLVHRALANGLVRARELKAAGLIWHVALVCQDWLVTLDDAQPRKWRPSAIPDLTHSAVGAVIA